MKRFRRVLFCLAAVMAVPMLFAADPTISLTATPRYPWNGKVDLKFTIGADETEGGYAAHQPGDDAIAGYRLKYVRSAGDAQLNTGVVPGSKNTIELKFAFDGTPASQNQCLYCARGATTATASYTCFLLEGRWRFDYNSASGTESATPTPVSGVPMVIRTVAGSASVDGVAVQSYTAANFTVGGQLALFSSYVETPGTRLGNYLKGKIYYLKIFGDDGTTLLHDFVPWEKDGVVGMYDTIAARFVAPNVGTLTCGTRGPKYDTLFTAKDVAGGTNLTMKTLYKSNGVAANPAKAQLLPGTYNWVWDAGEDLTRRWATYSGCVPTNSAVLFANVQLSELSEFYAVPCGKAVSDKSNLSKGAYIKDDGAGKSVQFAFSDDVYTKCVCVHLEQSGANVVGYAKWARYVTGTGHEESDFDSNSATELGIATSETERGYGLIKLQAKGAKINDAKVVEQVVVDGNIAVSAFLYTVKFNANGGTGTMADEPLAYGIEKALTANAFTRTGYTFQGWATSAAGTVVYSDKQSVSNLTATADATVNLYAVWKVFVPVMDGLKVYWPFDGNGKDLSGNDNNLSGSSVSYSTDHLGAAGGAVYFNGSASLTLSKSIGVSGTMTIVFWAKPEKSDNYQYGDLHMGYGNYGYSHDDFPMIIMPAYNDSERVNGELGIAVGKDRIVVFEWSPGLDAYYSRSGTYSGWHHYAITINNGGAPVVYMDGTKLSGDSLKFKIASVRLATKLTVGGRAKAFPNTNPVGNQAYKGYLDDFMVYNRVLSVDEIKKLFNKAD